MNEEHLKIIGNKREEVLNNILLTEKSLENFSQLQLLLPKIKNCNKECLEKFSETKIKEKYSNWHEKKIQLTNCFGFCEDKYKNVLNHQIKGAEISFFTFEKQIKKCLDYKSEDPIKLLECIDYKVGKLTTRFNAYYLNQRNNLIDRVLQE